MTGPFESLAKTRGALGERQGQPIGELREQPLAARHGPFRRDVLDETCG